MIIMDDTQFKLEFANTILSLNHKINLLMKQTANSYGYSSKACNLIYFIKLHDGLTLNELSNKLNADKGNLSRLINELIKLGFLNKQKGVQDKRKTHIHITREGEGLINQMKDECFNNIEEILSIYYEDEKYTLIKLMKKLDVHMIHLLYT